MPNETKTCPDCAETVKAAAKKCRYCGHMFEKSGLIGETVAAGMKAATESAAARAETANGQGAKNNKQKNIGCSIALLAIIVIAIVGSMGGGGDDSATDAETIAADAEQRQKGFHCLSQWDGSNRSTVQQIKDGLRNPDSFEHVETRITPVDEAAGDHQLVMTYRAQNGFGGMNVEKAYARIDSSTCEARIL